MRGHLFFNATAGVPKSFVGLIASTTIWISLLFLSHVTVKAGSGPSDHLEPVDLETEAAVRASAAETSTGVNTGRESLPVVEIRETTVMRLLPDLSVLLQRNIADLSPPKQEAEPYDAKNRFFHKQSSSWERAILATRVVPVNQPQPDVEFPLDRLPLGNSTPQHRVAVAGRSEAGEHEISFPPLNESLRISRRELPVLKRHAEAGDVEAAMRLATYYGFFLDNREKRNRELQIHYNRVAAAHGSQTGIENLIFLYSISTDRFDLSKACHWRRELKRLAARRNMQVQSDAEWYYDLYSEYFVARRSVPSKRNKKLGLQFLECAAKLGLKEAQRELTEVYSDDPDTQIPKKTRDWRERSDASNLAPSRTLALVSSVTESRLGSSIDDFRSAWGTPIREDVFDRTARIVWEPPPKNNEELPKGIFAAEVSFLDKIACEIVLRSNHPLKKTGVAKLAKTLVPDFQTSDLATIKSENDGGITYTLTSGGYITAWPTEKPAVVVMRSALFLRNNELFDREAAKVRPPTSNH